MSFLDRRLLCKPDFGVPEPYILFLYVAGQIYIDAVSYRLYAAYNPIGILIAVHQMHHLSYVVKNYQVVLNNQNRIILIYQRLYEFAYFDSLLYVKVACRLVKISKFIKSLIN